MVLLFNKPSWVKPEINEIKYWVHLLIIAAVYQTILFLFARQSISGLSWQLLWNNLLTLKTIYVALVVGIGDVIAHTILRIN